MFKPNDIEKFLFLDIETAPGMAQFQDLDPEMQKCWEKKARQYYKVEPEVEFDVESAYFEKAGLFAEFNRVVCVSTGYILWTEGKPVGYTQSFCGTDEKAILSAINDLLNKPLLSDYCLCGHNIKEFDSPVLARRMLINDISPLPSSLNNYGKKPWQVPHIDTLELWKFGDFKNYTSLALLTHLFNIPSPKTNVDGSQVGKLYWQDKDYQGIAEYCEGDVQATMNLVLRLSGLTIVHDFVRKGITQMD